MYSHEVFIRVRYAETDQMGVVYYGNYLTYYEVARVEALRNLGIEYKSLEHEGYIMPVLENKSKYIAPALYDENLRIVVTIPKIPGIRCGFSYEIFNEENKLIHIGETTLVFVSKETNRPTDPPQKVINALKPFYPNEG